MGSRTSPPSLTSPEFPGWHCPSSTYILPSKAFCSADFLSLFTVVLAIPYILFISLKMLGVVDGLKTWCKVFPSSSSHKFVPLPTLPNSPPPPQPSSPEECLCLLLVQRKQELKISMWICTLLPTTWQRLVKNTKNIHLILKRVEIILSINIKY